MPEDPYTNLYYQFLETPDKEDQSMRANIILRFLCVLFGGHTYFLKSPFEMRCSRCGDCREL